MVETSSDPALIMISCYSNQFNMDVIVRGFFHYCGLHVLIQNQVIGESNPLACTHGRVPRAEAISARLALVEQKAANIVISTKII